MHTAIVKNNDKVYYRSATQMLMYEEDKAIAYNAGSHIFENLEAAKEYACSSIDNIYEKIMHGYIKLDHSIDPKYIKVYKNDNVFPAFIYYDKPGIHLVEDANKVLYRNTIQHIVICDSGCSRYIKMGNLTISKKNNLYIITDHRGVVCETIACEYIEDIVELLDEVSAFIESIDIDYVSGDDFNIPINSNENDCWELIVKLPIKVNGITIKPGTILTVRDKFPGPNHTNTKKDYWSINDSHGGTFIMSYEGRKKYFEGVI